MHIRCPSCDDSIEVLGDSPLADMSCPHCGSTIRLVSGESTSDRPPAGRRSDPDEPLPTSFGRYRVVEVLARGGFGTVYLAMDDELQRKVAIKVPRRDRFRSGAAAEEFLAEARSAAQLRELPGIVPVYDVGRTEDGTVYVVMDYVSGPTLHQILKRERPSPERIAELLIAIATSAHAAHKKGFVHRDLKPGNVLLDARGQPRITDFGLAIHESVQRDKPGEFAGTVRYMSPEQVRGESHRLDGRADIWALGVMLYELLTGRPPFDGTTVDHLSDEILNREPKPLRQIDEQISKELERICLRCLAKPLSERYPTAFDLASDLRSWMDSSVARKSDAQVPSSQVSEAKAASPAVLDDSRPLVLTAAHPWGIATIIVGVAVLALAILIATTIWRPLTNESPEPIDHTKQFGSELALRGHTNIVQSVAFSPDSKLLASGSADDLLGIWEVGVWDKFRTLAGHTDRVTTVTFTPDSQQVISASYDQTVRFWNVATGQLDDAIAVGGGVVYAVACSHDGRQIATGSADRIIRVWDTDSHHELHRLVGHEEHITGVVFSPDGRRIASSSWDGTLKIWDPLDVVATISCVGHQGGVHDLDICPDGRLLVSGGQDRSLRIWDTATGNEEHSLWGHEGPVLCVCFSPDGRRVVSGSADKTIRIWSMATEVELHRLPSVKDVFSVATSQDGERIAWGCQDGSIEIRPATQND